MSLSQAFPITLDKPRTIRYETMQLMRAEKEVGVKLPSTMASGAFGFAEVVALLLAGLRHEEPSMTVEQCAELVDEYGLEYFGDLVNAFAVHLNRPRKTAMEKAE